MSTSRTGILRLADRSFAAVLFDLDGTLVSSTRVVDRAWAQLVEEYAVPRERLFSIHGIPARAVLARFLVDRTPDEREAAFQRVLALELADLDGVDVLPGAAAAMGALVPEGRCAVVTSGTRDLATARLRAVGLPVPDVLVTADDVTHGKPAAEPYLAGAAGLRVAAAECLVIEDAPAGITSGRAAGAAVLALATTHAVTEVEGADAVVTDLAAVRLSVEGSGVRLTPPARPHAPGTDRGSKP